MFGEINAIRALATKYSKPQLANLVQTGQLEPQKAVLAGMMIDRIAKSAMEPPQTTVAQDVLGAAPTSGQMPPGQMQQGQMPPQMPPQNAGVSGLPSGINDMAGGGIVAFADGGDVPRFAERGYVDPNLFKSVIAAESGGNPNAVSPKGARGLAQLMPGTARDPGFGVEGVRDDSPKENVRVGRDYLNALIKKYGNIDYALAAYNMGPGNTDKWIARGAKPEELPAETRAYIPKVKAGMAQMDAKSPMPGGEQLAGIADLIPSAQAADTQRIPAGPASLRAQAAKAASAEEEASYDPMTGMRISGPEPKPYDPTVKPGTIVEPNPIRDILQGRPRAAGAQPALPPIAPPKKAQDTTVNTLKPESAAPAAEEKPSMGPARSTNAAQLGNFYGASMEEPKERTLQDVMKDQAEADRAYGVDTKKMFDDLRLDYKNSAGNLKNRADKAAGMAFMMFGAGLAGAKRGRVGEAVSRSGQQALTSYMGAMEKINDNEDKLQQRLQDLSIAENQFNRGRSDKALAEVQSSKKDIQAIRLENAKLENQALIKAAEFRVDIFKNENPAQYTLLKNIAIESGKTPAEIFMIANGVAKTGGMTLKDALEGVQRNMKYAGMTFPEQMQIAREGIGEGGSGLPKPKTAADAEKLPPGTRYQAPDGSIRTKQ
jgi:hypothetical protein